MPRITKSSTKAKRSQDKERRREEILLVTEQVFREKGYPVATTDMLAESAGISVGTIYNLFGSKEGLYAEIIRRIAEDLLSRVEKDVLRMATAEKAIESLLKIRLKDFERHRLFFILFSCENASGVYPTPEQLSPEMVSLHYRYLDLVKQIFLQGMDRGEFETTDALHLALSLEGTITAFMNYWSRPEQTESLATLVNYIRDTFFQRSGLRSKPTTDPLLKGTPVEERSVYLSKFDTERIKELISVARWFGKDESKPHLDELEKAIMRGKIVSPKTVPGDVITMNSKIELRDMVSETMLSRKLAFPVDAAKEGDSVSILEPMGTVLLGCRVGDIVEFAEGDGRRFLRVEKLLYQPESAGDFHL